jgi:hypothetical protein
MVAVPVPVRIRPQRYQSRSSGSVAEEKVECPRFSAQKDAQMPVQQGRSEFWTCPEGTGSAKGGACPGSKACPSSVWVVASLSSGSVAEEKVECPRFSRGRFSSSLIFTQYAGCLEVADPLQQKRRRRQSRHTRHVPSCPLGQAGKNGTHGHPCALDHRLPATNSHITHDVLFIVHIFPPDHRELGPTP